MWEGGSTYSIETSKDSVTPAKFRSLTPYIMLMTILRGRYTDKETEAYGGKDICSLSHYQHTGEGSIQIQGWLQNPWGRFLLLFFCPYQNPFVAVIASELSANSSAQHLGSSLIWKPQTFLILTWWLLKLETRGISLGLWFLLSNLAFLRTAFIGLDQPPCRGLGREGLNHLDREGSFPWFCEAFHAFLLPNSCAPDFRLSARAPASSHLLGFSDAAICIPARFPPRACQHIPLILSSARLPEFTLPFDGSSLQFQSHPNWLL